MEDSDEVQDLDVSRFIPKEVDHAGITMASADRFTARAPPSHDTDGETEYLISSFVVSSPLFL